MDPSRPPWNSSTQTDYHGKSRTGLSPAYRHDHDDLLSASPLSRRVYKAPVADHHHTDPDQGHHHHHGHDDSLYGYTPPDHHTSHGNGGTSGDDGIPSVQVDFSQAAEAHPASTIEEKKKAYRQHLIRQVVHTLSGDFTPVLKSPRPGKSPLSRGWWVSHPEWLTPSEDDDDWYSTIDIRLKPTRVMHERLVLELEGKVEDHCPSSVTVMHCDTQHIFEPLMEETALDLTKNVPGHPLTWHFELPDEPMEYLRIILRGHQGPPALPDDPRPHQLRLYVLGGEYIEGSEDGDDSAPAAGVRRQIGPSLIVASDSDSGEEPTNHRTHNHAQASSQGGREVQVSEGNGVHSAGNERGSFGADDIGERQHVHRPTDEGIALLRAARRQGHAAVIHKQMESAPGAAPHLSPHAHVTATTTTRSGPLPVTAADHRQIREDARREARRKRERERKRRERAAQRGDNEWADSEGVSGSGLSRHGVEYVHQPGTPLDDGHRTTLRNIIALLRAAGGDA